MIILQYTNSNNLTYVYIYLYYIMSLKVWAQQLPPQPALKESTLTVLLSVFLSVGIPTVQRTYKNVSESYLNETLNSLLTQLPPEEHQHVLFVILLADTDEGSRAKVRRSLEENFDWYIAQNMIHVISAPASFYPQLHGLPKTLHDGEERMYWRAKQTMDYVFLIHYCEGLAQYYMQLEDDVLIKPNYMQAIRELIDETVDLDWPYLQFTPWGFIGKVVRSENLTRLGRFLRMFYYEMPCDWLLYMTREFYNIRQEDTFFTSEELFTHIGHQSSSLGT